MKWHAAFAWLPDGLARDVTLTESSGRYCAIDAGTEAPSDAVRLPGLVLPGLANGHSHAFHRALRGRTHTGRGSFWTWRERMYTLAERLDPDRYLALARAVYAEMVLAGVTAVGEFHYLHHRSGGRSYDDPNAMGAALVEAARQAGLRLTLLDACYLSGGLDSAGHRGLDPVQQRFSDGDAEAWAARLARWGPSGPGPADQVVLGAAVHSIRAVPRSALGQVVEYSVGRPLHVHLSEQPAENEACQAYYGCSPTELLVGSGALGPHTSAIHATHLSDADVALLGDSRTGVCICPTTERDLADGIGPARRLADAGSGVFLGSDQHAVVDILEEARALEMDERLASGERGRFGGGELLASLTRVGHGFLGWPDAGRLEVGDRADLVHIRLDTVRTAGAPPGQAFLVATAADVDTVVADGVTVVADGCHRMGDVGRLLTAAIEPLWDQP